MKTYQMSLKYITHEIKKKGNFKIKIMDKKYKEIIKNKKIDLLVELIRFRGCKKSSFRSLQNGKHVVTTKQSMIAVNVNYLG